MNLPGTLRHHSTAIQSIILEEARTPGQGMLFDR